MTEAEVEYLERNNKVFEIKGTNTILDMKKGDKIHKDYDSMVDNIGLDSLMSSIMMNDLNIKAPEVNNQVNVSLDNETTNQILRKLVKVMSNNQPTTLVKSEKSRKTWR